MNKKNDELPISLKLKSELNLSNEIKVILNKFEEKLGFLPNVFKSFYHNSKKLASFLSFRNEIMLGNSGLSLLQKEMIAVVVSSINNCHYCLVSHSAAVRELSNNPILGDILIMNYRVSDISYKDMVMLNFAEKLTKESSKINEYDREELRKAGFSENDIWDICEVVGFFNYTNRLASGTKMIPNTEYYFRSRKKV